MSASANDLFMKLGGSSSLVNTPKVTSPRAGGGTTLAVDNCNWDQTTGKIFATYKVDTSNNVVAGTEIIWKGVVNSTTSIGSLSRIAGASDTGSAIGDIVELLPASAWANNLVSGLLSAGLTQAGGMGAIAPTSVTSTGAVSGTTGTFSGAVSDTGTALSTYRAGVAFDFVESGCVITADNAGTNKNYSVTSGVVWLSGKRLTVASVSAQTVGASKDRYIDLHDNGDGTAIHVTNEVSNNAASQALTAGNLRLGIVVAGATTIANAASINQGQEDRVLPIASSIAYSVTDSLGNLICPRDPNRRVLGQRQIIANLSSLNSGSLAILTGLNVPVIVPAGRKIKVSMGGGWWQSVGGATDVTWAICDGSTSTVITQTASSINSATNYRPTDLNSNAITPGSTSKTYLAAYDVDAVSVTLNAASTYPVWIRVELV